MTLEYRIGEYVVSLVDDHIGTPRLKEVVYPDVGPSEWEPYLDFALDLVGYEYSI